jgi:tryptophan synthase alpha subunit
MLSLVAHLIRARINGVILPDRPPDTSNDGMSSCRPTAAKLSAICTAGSNTQGGTQRIRTGPDTHWG